MGHGGSCAAELGRSRSSGDVVLDDSPDTVSTTTAGATYAASACPGVFTLRVRELRGGAVVRTTAATLTADGGWKQLVVATPGAAGGTSLSVEVVASLARATKAQVDDVSLKRS